MTAATKLTEAKFFLELLDALQNRRVALTHAASSGEEASFLMSAVLNSLYSALEQAKPIIGIDAVKFYKSENPHIFKGSGGLRNITVHERHVGVDFAGYIPPPGNAVNFDFRPTPRLVEEARSARSSGNLELNLGPDFYVELDGKLVEIGKLCHKQYYSLRSFFKEYGIVT